MRAIVQTGFGPAPEVLEVREIEAPTPGPGEVLVRVKAAGIARGNWLITRGLPWIARPMFGFRTPKQPISGLQFSGVIEALGPEVDRFQVGDAVFGSHPGAFAERIAAPVTALARKPETVSFEAAAATPISGTTGLQAVRDAAHVRPGQRVLVIGASGGVGSFAVQIARAYGAEVTGVASTASLERVRALGASETIDYTREAIDARGTGYDAVLNIAGNRPVSEMRSVLKRDGVLVMLGGTGSRLTMGFGRTVGAVLLDRLVSQKLIALLSIPNAADLEELAELMADGRVRAEIEPALPLERAPEAVARLGNGHRGGTLVLTP